MNSDSSDTTHNKKKSNALNCAHNHKCTFNLFTLIGSWHFSANTKCKFDGKVD